MPKSRRRDYYSSDDESECYCKKCDKEKRKNSHSDKNTRSCSEKEKNRCSYKEKSSCCCLEKEKNTCSYADKERYKTYYRYNYCECSKPKCNNCNCSQIRENRCNKSCNNDDNCKNEDCKDGKVILITIN